MCTTLPKDASEVSPLQNNCFKRASVYSLLFCTESCEPFGHYAKEFIEIRSRSCTAKPMLPESSLSLRK